MSVYLVTILNGDGAAQDKREAAKRDDVWCLLLSNVTAVWIWEFRKTVITELEKDVLFKFIIIISLKMAILSASFTKQPCRTGVLSSPFARLVFYLTWVWAKWKHCRRVIFLVGAHTHEAPLAATLNPPSKIMLPPSLQNKTKTNKLVAWLSFEFTHWAADIKCRDTYLSYYHNKKCVGGGQWHFKPSVWQVKLSTFPSLSHPEMPSKTQTVTERSWDDELVSNEGPKFLRSGSGSRPEQSFSSAVRARRSHRRSVQWKPLKVLCSSGMWSWKEGVSGTRPEASVPRRWWSGWREWSWELTARWEVGTSESELKCINVMH